MIFTMLLVAASALFAAPANADETDFDAFFKDFSAKRDGIVALEAKFNQRSLLPDEELTTKGLLLFIKPRRIIFRTDEPARVTLVDDRRGYEYDSEIKQLQIFDIEDNPQADIFFLGFDSNTETLRQVYDVTLFTTADDPRGKRGLTIRPKAESKEEAYFIEVQLYLRDEDYLPYRIHIQNDKESEVFIDVESIDKTVRPSGEMTQILLPENTKIVENDRVVETVGPGGKRLPDALLLPPPGMESSKPVEVVPTETRPAETKPAKAEPVKAKQAAPTKKAPAKTKSSGTKPAAAKPAGTKSTTAKPATTKPVEAKPAQAKPAATKPAETKSTMDKPAETKPIEAKPAESKPLEIKPIETKLIETKPAETKPVEIKPAEAKPVETKPAEKIPAAASEKQAPKKNPKQVGSKAASKKTDTPQ